MLGLMRPMRVRRHRSVDDARRLLERAHDPGQQPPAAIQRPVLPLGPHAWRRRLGDMAPRGDGDVVGGVDDYDVDGGGDGGGDGDCVVGVEDTNDGDDGDVTDEPYDDYFD